ncbi:Bro-N domain-containing protein [Blautia sp.]|uniref:BRO-N domain-containing protein n=1 Tax=Blautia sp. TaxID=1955243 RepID=UPI003AB64A67
MNELKIFENAEFGQVRTVTIDSEPWFVGKDVAEALGYSDTNKAVAMHVEEYELPIILKEQIEDCNAQMCI